MSFDPNCMALAIGTVPHTNIDAAIDLVLECLPEAPIWPQFTKLGLFESMMVQYTEGMPCIKIDPARNRAYFDTSGEDYIDEVSERFALALDGKFDEFKITKEYSKGFYALKDRLSSGFPSTVRLLKGHVTGPISFGLSMHDENGRSILYNDNMKDALVKILAMKAKWQESEFKKLSPEVETLIFFDEPSMTQIGTPFISIQPDEAVEILNACFDELDGLKGLHVCGNTDWSLVAKTHTDIINFDAYLYPGSISLYPDEIRSFMDRGGMIAWGITPSTEAIEKEDGESILKRFESAVELLCDAGFDKAKVLKRSFVSPSCGTGTLTESQAEKVFRLNFELSNLIRKKYF